MRLADAAAVGAVALLDMVARSRRRVREFGESDADRQRREIAEWNAAVDAKRRARRRGSR